ncbi:LPS assembly protein LptD [Actinobacillus lignieresii]|uniref:LPS-assembly protein LptD n=1 Tax=Actinobacillus lignieresii TaxID=720 RepID=A0A380TR17_ACTLI|nr:LPS assembly protein LptD [Actinobacillus lignieresii]SUT90653.1 organic solvent tolerance protein [Actinobacillus lignieresii]
MKTRYSVLSVAMTAAFYTQYAQADLREQCLLGVPHFQGEEATGDQTMMPIEIEADNAVINQPKDATYTGDVAIKQGNRSLFADEVRVEQNGEQERRAFLKGSYRYQDNLIQAHGRDAAMDLSSETAELQNTEFQLVGRQGRGTAESGSFNHNKRILKNATFTACLPNDNAWSIEGNEMIQHIDEEYAEIWHARFKVLGMPVFYSPYLQFPIGDRRRSGLLIPNFHRSSKDGFAYSQPFYWNIAPNMDATITPTYYSRRGWQISPEYRYLTKLGEGIVAGEYIGKDRLDEYKPDDNDRKRYLIHWRHNMSFLTDWRLYVDYTKVSDKRYFSDFDSEYGSSTDGYATQQFKLGYYQPNYNLSISGKKFQTFDELDVGPYRVLPQIDFNYYNDELVKGGDFKLFAQTARFENDSKLMPKAWRFHVEPTLNFPLANRYGSLNFETKLYATHYLQEKGSSKQADDMDKNVTRVIPQVKVDLQTVLEADKQLFKGFNQTFEPRVQYVYRPYKDQSNIGSGLNQSVSFGYDSALLQSDYFSLFNDRRYSGLDRISSANLITAGGTNRFFNEKTGVEVFNFSIGQTYYLSPSKIDDLSQNSTTKRSSSWALESNWKFHTKWNWHGAYQYDTRLNQTSLANTSLQYKPSQDKLVQLSYRFASKDYINQNLRSNVYGQDIKQVGAIVGWELTDRVAFMASHYHDIALKKPVESQLSVNYNTCCWSANVYVARKLTATPIGSPDTINDLYYDNKFGVNFELRFGTNYSSGVRKMLKKGMIPYTEQYGIN